MSEHAIYGAAQDERGMAELVPASRREADRRDGEVGEAVGPAIGVAVQGVTIGRGSPDGTDIASPSCGPRLQHHRAHRPLAAELQRGPPGGTLVSERSGLKARTDARRLAVG